MKRPLDVEYLETIRATIDSALSARRHGRTYTYQVKVGRAHRLLGVLVHNIIGENRIPVERE